MNTEETGNLDGQLQPGTILQDRYEIQSILGEGGFAVVYLAFDQTIERKVAIKILHARLSVSGNESTELIRTRFLREARTAAKIRHPSIIEIYDFGVLDDNDRPYMIMEYLEGTDLDDELSEQGGVAPTRLLPLFVDALEALDEAHDRDVVHKDLKPSNLFLSHRDTPKERLKIVDFGIAHVSEQVDERLTKTGAMTGTPYYLPPEYVEEQEVGTEMDIYQMGLILVEAISGTRVIEAETAYQAAFRHVSRDFSLPAPLLEGDMGDVLSKALEYSPDDRFSTAGEFAEALRGVDPAAVEERMQDADSATTPIGTQRHTRLSHGGADPGTDVGRPSEFADVDADSTEAADPSESDDSDSALSMASLEASFESKWPIKVLAVLGVGTLLLGGVLVVLLSSDPHDDSDLDSGDEIAEDVPAEDDEDLAEVGPSSSELDEEPQEQHEEDDDTAQVLAVESTPEGADIRSEDGSALGETPTELESDGLQTITVEHSGYEAKDIDLDDYDGELSVQLQPKTTEEPEMAEEPESAEEPEAVEEPQPAPEPEAPETDDSEVAAESDPAAPEADDADDDDSWAMPGDDGDDGDDPDDDPEDDDSGFQIAQ